MTYRARLYFLTFCYRSKFAFAKVRTGTRFKKTAGSRPNRLFWLPPTCHSDGLPIHSGGLPFRSPVKTDQQHFPEGEVFFPFGEVFQHVPQHRYHYVPSPCGFVSSTNKSSNVRGAVWHVPTPGIRAAGLPPNMISGAAMAAADSPHCPQYTVTANLAASGKLFGRFQHPAAGSTKKVTSAYEESNQWLTSMASTAPAMSAVPAVAYPSATGPYHCYFVSNQITFSRGYANRGGGIRGNCNTGRQYFGVGGGGGETGHFHNMGLRYV